MRDEPGMPPGELPGGGTSPGGGSSGDDSSPGERALGYRARLRALLQPRYDVPAIHLMITEYRSGGWAGAVQINPRLGSAEQAVRAVIDEGLAPGEGTVVQLQFGNSIASMADRAVRTWPSVVTAVNAREAVGNRHPFCSVSFTDPLTALCKRTIWAAYADTPLDAVVGGAMSTATGGDGAPTRTPILPGGPRVEIETQVREEISTLPYVIAAGESLGLWLSRICAQLGVRVEMVGAPDGLLKIAFVDTQPALSGMNARGPVSMTIDPRAGASAGNIVVEDFTVQAVAPARGGLLDNPSGGEAYRFGSPGPVGQVISDAQTSEDEAERRAGFRTESQVLEQLRVSGVTSHPGLLPGRTIEIVSGADAAGDDSPDGAPSDSEDAPRSYSSMFGATLWQVARIAHLLVGESYWNRVDIEKTGVAWRPPMPDEEGGVMVSGIVDDGKSELGEPVERDWLGRIPVRFPFAMNLATDEEEPPPTGEYRWPASLPLAPIAPIAGRLHGFVSGHRQGDWCRVHVVSPLFAEIAGFSYRDDRSLKQRVRDVTMGLVVSQSEDLWRGMIFRPDEDIEAELDDSVNSNNGKGQ